MPHRPRSADWYLSLIHIFVQLPAGAVAHELADDGEAGVLAVSLDGIADVADAVAGHSLLDALVAVSYTHLDVYKRQDMCRMAGLILYLHPQAADIHIHDLDVAEVVFTPDTFEDALAHQRHTGVADVYKRQPP